MPLQPETGEKQKKISVHGGIDYAEMKKMGLDPDAIIDFSVCTNPLMPPPGINEKLADIRIDRYPDSYCMELRHRLSNKTGIRADNILVGSGTTELLRLVTAAFFRNGDRVLLLEPTYGDYEVTSRMIGTRLIKHQAREENYFQTDVNEAVALIRRQHPKAAIICNPNNPTGHYLSHSEIEAIIEAMSGGLIFLDEAYIAFIEKSWNSLELISGGNLVVLRSMTKDYNIPGLRLGYAVACREIIECMSKVLPPWNVNIIAQKVGAAVLEEDGYLQESLRHVREAKKYLEDEISRLGLRALPSDANYFLIKVGNAREFRFSLLKDRILVRDCTSFGLPEYIRISARTLPECREFIQAVERLIQKGE